MRLLLTIFTAFLVAGCGGGGGNDESSDTVHYVQIKDSSLNAVSLSGEDFAQLLAAPKLTGGENGGGSIELKLGYGDWISEFTEQLHSNTTIPAIVVVTGTVNDDGNVIETSREEYQNALLTGEVLHGSDSEEYVNYTFSFEQHDRTENEVVHDIGEGVFQGDSPESMRITRFINFRSPGVSADAIYAGHTKFPAVAPQTFLASEKKPNTLIQVLSYTISLYRSGTESPGFKVEMVDDSVFLELIKASQDGHVFPIVTLYEVDTGRPARLRKVYLLQDVTIENPVSQPGNSTTNGRESLSANLSTFQFNSTVLKYDRAGRYSESASLCTNIENGPQSCFEPPPDL